MIDFKRLDVYRAAMEFLVLAVRVSSRMPRGNHDLADQLRRAASSIPLNIAEGAGRFTQPDRARFYNIARASAYECAAALQVGEALGVVDRQSAAAGEHTLERVISMLTKMCR